MNTYLYVQCILVIYIYTEYIYILNIYIYKRICYKHNHSQGYGMAMVWLQNPQHMLSAVNCSFHWVGHPFDPIVIYCNIWVDIL
jgi:hypothetical protein